MSEPSQTPGELGGVIDQVGAREGTFRVSDTVQRLRRLAVLAEKGHAPGLADSARLLAARADGSRFYVAWLGQFKRGKSTLIDALVEDAVLPAGIVPVTSVPTVVRHGEHRAAWIRNGSGEWSEIAPEDLIRFVSEEHNPENRLGIMAVEVFVASPLLQSGMCLVDTPGLGSVFRRSTATTREFVPQVDAALAVIGADPPITGEELDLFQEVAGEVPDLLFVLNKADRLSVRECTEAAAFARSALEQALGHPIARIFQVSARERLERQGPPRDWGELVRALNQLAERSGTKLVARGAERRLSNLGQRFLDQLAQERELLLRPMEESRRRVDDLEQTIASAEQSLSDLSHLLSAEQERLGRSFAERRRKFLLEVRPLAAGELEAGWAALKRRPGPALRREAMRMAQKIARQRLLPWLQLEQGEAERAYRASAERFDKHAEEFLERLAQTGSAELLHVPSATELDVGLNSPPRFYFKDLIRIAEPASPFRFLLDVLLGGMGLTRSIYNDAARFLDWLLEMNSIRVESDLNDRVLESRRRLETSIRSLLQEVRSSAETALDRATATRDAGADAVARELARIAGLQGEVHRLIADR